MEKIGLSSKHSNSQLYKKRGKEKNVPTKLVFFLVYSTESLLIFELFSPFLF